MKPDKKEIIDLIDSLGNNPGNTNQNNPNDWLKGNNQFEDPINPSNKKSKPGCKSGKCGNNTTGIVIFSILAVLLMFAGYGFGKLVELAFK